MASDNDEMMTGHCMCGDIRFEYRGPPLETAHCHCESCRRHTSSSFVTYIVVDRGTFRFTKGSPVIYESSPGVLRGHCGRCGSPLTYENSHELAIYACTLDDLSRVEPTFHVRSDEQLPWIEIADQLPRYGHGKRDVPMRIGPRLSVVR
jgi:hypothetical protein